MDRSCLPIFQRTFYRTLALLAAGLPGAVDLARAAAEPVPAPIESEGQLIPVQAEAPAVAVDEVIEEPAATAAQLAPAPRTGAPIVALLDFESDTLPDDQLAALSQALQTRLEQLGGLRMLPRDETRRWLIRNDLYPGLPYQAEVPLGRVAQALNSDYVIVGRIDRIENMLSAQMTLQQLGAPQALQKNSINEATPTELLQGMDLLAGQLKKVIQGADPELIWQQIGKSPSGVVAAVAKPAHKTSAGVHKIKLGSAKGKIIEDRGADEKHHASTSAVERESRGTAPAAAREEAAAQAAGVLIPVPTAAAIQRTSELESLHAESEPQPAAQPEAAPAANGEHQLAAAAVPHAAQAAVGPEHQPSAVPAKPAAEAAKPEAPKQELAKPASPGPAGAPAPPELSAASAAHPAPPAKERATPANPAETAPAIAERARELYQAALALDRDSPERIAKLEEAALIDSGNVTYQDRLANEYYRRGQFKQAIEACNRALKLNPADSMLMTVKGSAHFELKDYDAACKAQRAALQADDGNNWARFNLALAQTQMNSPDAAKAWQDYLDHAKDDPAHADLLGEARRHLAALQTKP